MGPDYCGRKSLKPWTTPSLQKLSFSFFSSVCYSDETNKAIATWVWAMGLNLESGAILGYLLSALRTFDLSDTELSLHFFQGKGKQLHGGPQKGNLLLCRGEPLSQSQY